MSINVFTLMDLIETPFLFHLLQRLASDAE